MVAMRANVLSVHNNRLVVFDHDMSQEVIVHTPQAYRFCVGDYILIQYRGAMTASIPPQISATSISVIPRCRPRRGHCR